ncbi:MAG: hypothetical protein KBA46_03535 [Candidatus Omnitrophica bacterium]|nr:hypothetical protein [Candidatus Omnitrophota bacterium]
MTRDSEQILDRLRRALEMEEVMAQKIVVLCQEGVGDAFPHPARNKAKGALAVLQKDTLRHAKIVNALIKVVSKKGNHG